MKTKVQSKLVRNLTNKEYQECRRLTFRSRGSMMDDITYHRNVKTPTARVIIIRAETGEIAAWALLQPKSHTGRRTKNIFLVYFYTRAKYRRQGYASRLLRYVQRYDPKPEVAPHDPRSGGFFRTVRKDITVPSYSRHWVV